MVTILDDGLILCDVFAFRSFTLYTHCQTQNMMEHSSYILKKEKRERKKEREKKGREREREREPFSREVDSFRGTNVCECVFDLPHLHILA